MVEFYKVQQQEVNRIARYCKQFTQLALSNYAMNALTDKYIDRFYSELRPLHDQCSPRPSG